MNVISVNQALASKAIRNGECFEVEGLLAYGFENVSLNHWPKAEQCGDPYASSIWIDADGVFSFDEDVMTRWNGKRVVVLGVFEDSIPSGVDGWDNGFGHFGLWPTRIKARRIDLLKRRRRDHPECHGAE